MAPRAKAHSHKTFLKLNKRDGSGKVLVDHEDIKRLHLNADHASIVFTSGGVEVSDSAEAILAALDKVCVGIVDVAELGASVKA